VKEDIPRSSSRLFEDRRLSFGAVGIIGYLGTKPKKMAGSIAELVSSSRDTEDEVRKLLRELQAHGYVRVGSDGTVSLSLSGQKGGSCPNGRDSPINST